MLVFYIQKQNTKSYSFNGHIEVKSNIFANQWLESHFQNKTSSARRMGCECVLGLLCAHYFKIFKGWRMRS